MSLRLLQIRFNDAESEKMSRARQDHSLQPRIADSSSRAGDYTSGAGIGPKNIRSAFSLPITRTNSCIVQYMAMRDEKNDLNGEEMRPDD